MLKVIAQICNTTIGKTFSSSDCSEIYFGCKRAQGTDKCALLDRVAEYIEFKV
jgi:hypothetical protein